MQAIQQACFLWFCSHLLSSSCTCLYERSDYHGEVSQHKADGLQLSFIPLRDIWKWIQIVTYSRVIRVPRSDRFLSCVCLRKGSRKKKKRSSRHQLHHVSVTVPGHRGQWDKSSCCPQNRARASIRTGRRLCGNRQRSLWSAELFLLCHRTSRSGRPFIHPIACQQVRGHTQRHTRIKKIHPTCSTSGPSAGVRHVVFGEIYCEGVWVTTSVFFVTRGYLCLFLPIWVYLYVSCLLVFELKDDGNTPGSRWPHVSDTVSLCLSLLPLLEAQHILAMLLDRTSSLILLLFSPYRWFTLARRHEYSLFATAKTSTQTTHKRKVDENASRMISYSFFFLPLFFPLPSSHTSTRAHSQIHTHQ